MPCTRAAGAGGGTAAALGRRPALPCRWSVAPQRARTKRRHWLRCFLPLPLPSPPPSSPCAAAPALPSPSVLRALPQGRLFFRAALRLLFLWDQRRRIFLLLPARPAPAPLRLARRPRPCPPPLSGSSPPVLSFQTHGTPTVCASLALSASSSCRLVCSSAASDAIAAGPLATCFVKRTVRAPGNAERAGLGKGGGKGRKGRRRGREVKRKRRRERNEPKIQPRSNQDPTKSKHVLMTRLPP